MRSAMYRAKKQQNQSGEYAQQGCQKISFYELKELATYIIGSLVAAHHYGENTQSSLQSISQNRLKRRHEDDDTESVRDELNHAIATFGTAYSLYMGFTQADNKWTREKMESYMEDGTIYDIFDF